MNLPGAFAMTETGHGSDVQAIGTTATYDPETAEFVVHTPFRGAWKDYLGNAGQHAKAATVFAQLVTGGVNYGVHCFLVPIRDDDGAFLPGVGGEDDGPKGGLNGVDNGRLQYHHVRVPRENLLNRYGDVAEDGAYSSPIASPGRRFFTMLGALVQGRVSLDGAATWGSALAMTIAVTYGNQRRQFDNDGAGETVLLDYGRHQRRLMPRLATVYAQDFAHDELLQKFDAVFSGSADTDDNRQDLETLAAALKPLSTWNALDIVQEAREACGGAGFLAENRLTGVCAATSTCTSPSRATTTCCCSWSASDCWATTPSSSRASRPTLRGSSPGRRPVHLQRRGAASARPGGDRLRLDRPLRRTRSARRPPARAAHRARRADGR